MKLLDATRQAIRVRHLSRRTEQACVHWIVRYRRFHARAAGTSPDPVWTHPNLMGDAEARRFLSDLAVNGKVSAGTQNQALAALLFLYRHVLDKPMGQIDAVRAAAIP